MADDPETVETVKYYTRARKFPQLLGRMPDGTKIPGGPYTVQQLIVAITIIVVGGMSIDMWGVFGTFGNIAVLFGATFGAVFLIGRLPMNGRNPFFALVGLFRAMGAPATGRYRGRPIRLRRPRTLTHRTNVYLGELPGTPAMATTGVAAGAALDAMPEQLRRRLRDRSSSPLDLPAGGEPTEAPAAKSGLPGPLTGVQALLALADDDTAENDRHKVVR